MATRTGAFSTPVVGEEINSDEMNTATAPADGVALRRTLILAFESMRLSRQPVLCYGAECERPLCSQGRLTTVPGAAVAAVTRQILLAHHPPSLPTCAPRGLLLFGALTEGL